MVALYTNIRTQQATAQYCFLSSILQCYTTSTRPARDAQDPISEGKEFQIHFHIRWEYVCVREYINVTSSVRILSLVVAFFMADHIS